MLSNPKKNFPVAGNIFGTTAMVNFFVHSAPSFRHSLLSVFLNFHRATRRMSHNYEHEARV